MTKKQLYEEIERTIARENITAVEACERAGVTREAFYDYRRRVHLYGDIKSVVPHLLHAGVPTTTVNYLRDVLGPIRELCGGDPERMQRHIARIQGEI